MASIEFHYRPSTRLKRSKGSVYIRVIHRRKTCSITTSLKIYPEEWNGKENCVKYAPGNEKRFPLLFKTEKEMKRILDLLHGTIDLWELQEHHFTAMDIVAAYRRSEGTGFLSDYVEKLCCEMHAAGQIRTARGYLTTCRRLIKFVGNTQLQIKEVTGLMMRRFEMLLEKEGKAPNTISFYMRNLRAIYNKAITEGLLEATPHSPFELVYTGVCQTKKRALSSQEMFRLSEWKPLSVESGKWKMESERGLRKAQQLFLFCFLARGMSFVDMSFLKKEDIRDGVIRYRRKKTGQQLEVLVCKEMKRIIRHFEKEVKDSPYVFPVIKQSGENERLQYESALRTQNNRLKRLTAQLKMKSEKLIVKGKDNTNKDNFQLSIFNFPLSSHVARHSWATIAKEKNVPLVVISESLGHTSERTTSIYLGSLDRSKLDKAGAKVASVIKTAG